MTVAIGVWLAEVYLLTTAVLLAACVAMRSLRQPARRLFVARCAAVGVVGLIGVSAWSSRPGVAGRSTIPAGKVAPPPPSPTDPGTLRVAGQESPPADLLAIGCEVPPPGPSPVLGCPDEEGSPPLLSAAGCEPVAPDGGTSRPASPGLMSGNPREARAVARGVSLAFLIGCGMMTAWLLAGARAAAGLLGRTIEAPRELRAKLSGVVGSGRRVPRLRIGPGVGQPFAIGVLRPTIVLPARFACEGEPEGRVEAALRHEWAHIRNGDLALLALLRGLLPLLFAHPAYWWLRRRVRADQEAMADAQAVRDGDRIGYAEALLAWARDTPVGTGRPHAGSLALWNRPSELRERITLLLSPPFAVENRCPRLWRLLVASIASAVVLPLAGLSMASPQGAEASSAASPHDCADCEGHAPPPALTLFSCPSEAAPVAEASGTASASG